MTTTGTGQRPLKMFKNSGKYIMAGALLLIIQFILIQLRVISVELPDHKLDLPTIFIAMGAWSFFFAGLTYLKNSTLLGSKTKYFYISLTGLFIYTAGCALLLFEQWDLMFVIPVGLLLTAVGMIILGIRSLYETSTSLQIKVALFAVGLYPFLCMFPIVAVMGKPNYSVNYFWGFLWLGLGYILHYRPINVAKRLH